MRNQLKNKWVWIVIVTLAALLLSRGALLPMFAKLARFLVPGILIYLAYRFTVKAFFPRPEAPMRSMPRYEKTPNTDAIVICADCGHEKAAQHRCQATT